MANEYFSQIEESYPRIPITHNFLLNLTKHHFRNEGFKVFTAQQKIPDVLAVGLNKEFYAIEVLLKPTWETIWEKIDKYLSEDIDGLYIVTPFLFSDYQGIWAKKRVVFLNYKQLISGYYLPFTKEHVEDEVG